MSNTAHTIEFFTVGGTFKYNKPHYNHEFRINSFLKAEKGLRWDMTDPQQADIAEILGEENDVVTRWYYCVPSEASHVSGSGVSGIVANVRDITMSRTRITKMLPNWTITYLSLRRQEHRAEDRPIQPNNLHL
jgi:hypothetical protein